MFPLINYERIGNSGNSDFARSTSDSGRLYKNAAYFESWSKIDAIVYYGYDAILVWNVWAHEAGLLGRDSLDVYIQLVDVAILLPPCLPFSFFSVRSVYISTCYKSTDEKNERKRVGKVTIWGTNSYITPGFLHPSHRNPSHNLLSFWIERT